MDRVLDRLPRNSRVAILRLRSLGDCVLTTPAIDVLKRARPDLHLAISVEDRFRAIFEGNPAIEEILPPAWGPLRRWRADLCLNLHGGTRSAWMTALSGARYRAGFAHFRQQFAYNVRIPRAQEILGVDRVVHTAEHLASAMFFLGAPKGEIPRARLFADPGPLPDGRGSDTGMLPDGRASALGAQSGTLPDSRGLQNHDRKGVVAVLHPFAATTEKTWSREGFLEVARHLQHSGLEPVFIGAAGDDLAPFSEFRTVSQSLAQTKQLLAGASVFVGNDSGPAHMAAAFGIPVVVIFGASNPAIWSPWRTDSVVVTAQGGIARVQTEQVLDALARLRVPV